VKEQFGLTYGDGRQKGAQLWENVDYEGVQRKLWVIATWKFT
jgi:hypothetical protein